jgi:hypothetical protein
MLRIRDAAWGLALSLTMGLGAAGCRTGDAGDANPAGITATDAAPASAPSGDVVAPTGQCTRDLNPFGHAGRCDCPKGFEYNAVIGKCTNQNRVCTLAIVSMFHPETGKCLEANNGCVASDLKTAGWRAQTTEDRCK